MGFCTNRNKVVSQIFDDEVIVVNLENGAYYSLRAAATAIWKLIERGCSRTQILSGTDQPQAQSVFLDFLLSENLILEDESAPGMPDILPCPGIPEYTKYEDMKDLLLLDPIHEVSATGWPDKKGE